MDAGGAWERLLHTPTTWIVVAVVLFVVAVVLLVAGARAGRAARRQRGSVAATPAVVPSASADEDEPVTEPSVPRRASAASGPGREVDGGDVEEDPVTEPAAPRVAAGPDRPDDGQRPGTEPVAPQVAVAGRPDDGPARRLLGVLVDDPSAALAGVAALERGEESGSAAVTLLRSGVPAPAVARLCGVEADDLGDLVAAALGILPEQGGSVVAAEPGPEDAEAPGNEPSSDAPSVDAPQRAAAPMS